MKKERKMKVRLLDATMVTKLKTRLNVDYLTNNDIIGYMEAVGNASYCEDSKCDLERDGLYPPIYEELQLILDHYDDEIGPIVWHKNQKVPLWGIDGVVYAKALNDKNVVSKKPFYDVGLQRLKKNINNAKQLTTINDLTQNMKYKLISIGFNLGRIIFNLLVWGSISILIFMCFSEWDLNWLGII